MDVNREGDTQSNKMWILGRSLIFTSSIVDKCIGILNQPDIVLQYCRKRTAQRIIPLKVETTVATNAHILMKNFKTLDFY
jgi:hypothetical protein